MRSRVLRAFRDDWRLIAALILALGMLAALVTVIMVLATRPDPAPAEPSRGAGRVPAGAGPALPEVEVQDLIVPNEGRKIETWSWERYRTPGEPWDPEQVERFWQDPDAAAQEYLQRRNDEEIERIFQKVP